MDMKISMRDKKMLLMFLGVGVFAAGYFLGYRPQMEKAESIQAANVPLQDRLDDLLKLAENKDFYIEETNSIQEQIDKYTSEFPVNVRQEDGIVLSMDMEDSLDGSTEDELVDMPDETLSEQANAQTEAQIDEIEGTDVRGDKERQIASDAEVEDMNSTTSVPVLYRTQDSMQFTGTYASLKDMVEYLADQSGRMTLDNVSASFDSSTGNLTGSITVNLFSMAGTGKTYTEPDAGSVAYGTNNIFGTIEKSKSKKKNKKSKKSADTEETQNANTADSTEEQAASADTGADGQNTANSQEGENTQDAAAPADGGNQS